MGQPAMVSSTGQDGGPPGPQPQVIQGIHGEQFQHYPLKHPANLHPSYRGGLGPGMKDIAPMQQLDNFME